ncbi:oxygenase MpaB family protein [Nocardia jiangsuensis]|uniref:Oxygenase MpaB family protein n=1 Tax=Nocardia jiangsuensis TaxID=1691563 RepID=A0ABV8DTP3_9NOCA
MSSVGQVTAPPGPDSLTWQYFGDRRTYPLAPAAGIMQLMLPGLGAGVTQHSDFCTEPREPIFRALDPDDPAETRLPVVPDLVWKLFGKRFMREYMVVAAGTMPPAVRERLGLRRGPLERARCTALVRRVWPLLPERVRYAPRALAGIARVRGAS